MLAFKDINIQIDTSTGSLSLALFSFSHSHFLLWGCMQSVSLPEPSPRCYCGHGMSMDMVIHTALPDADKRMMSVTSFLSDYIILECGDFMTVISAWWLAGLNRLGLLGDYLRMTLVPKKHEITCRISLEFLLNFVDKRLKSFCVQTNIFELSLSPLTSSYQPTQQSLTSHTHI